MKKLISLNKLISVGLASAILSCATSTVFAATDASALNVNNVYALWNGDKALSRTGTANGFSSGANGKLSSRAAGTVVDDITINEPYYYLEGNNTDAVRLVFGSSPTVLVANSTGANKGDNYRGITPLKSTLSKLSYTKNSALTSTSISISKGTYTVNVGSGDYAYALGFEIKFNNKSKNDAYAMYDLAVAGKTFKIVAHSTSNDTSDTSAADNDPDENGIVPYGGADTKYANGTVIYQPTLKYMYEKGATYGIKMKNGVDFIVSKVTKATSDAGNLTLNYSIEKDSSLIDRYSSAAGGNVLALDLISGFVNEKVKYNLDLGNDEISKTITDAQTDRWSDGRKVFVYVVNKSNLETAASASAADGIIDDQKKIVGSIVDSKVVFDVPAKYFDNTKEKLMVSLNEIDIASLPAVAGVSVNNNSAGTTSGGVNEVVAPIISGIESAPTIVESTPVVEAPTMEAPMVSVKEDTSMATSGAGRENTNTVQSVTSVPNTGLKDNLILAALAVLAAISSMCFIVYNKKENNA